jgi:hypothetical protein
MRYSKVRLYLSAKYEVEMNKLWSLAPRGDLGSDLLDAKGSVLSTP